MSEDNKVNQPLYKVSGIKFSEESVFLIGEGGTASEAFSGSRVLSTEEEKLRNVCWMETRVHPLKPCRDCRAEVWGEFEHPRIGEAIDAIRTCVRAASVASAIVTLISAISGAGGAIPASAAATFKTVLVECLINEGIGFANEITITLELREKHCERWTSNCEPCD